MTESVASSDISDVGPDESSLSSSTDKSTLVTKSHIIPITDDQIPVCRQHGAILATTKKEMNHVLTLTIFYVISWYLRYTIVILYIRSYFTENLAMIALIIYLSELFHGVYSFILGYFSDRYWRYDYLIVLISCFDAICILFQAFAWNIVIFGIFFILSTPPFNTLTKAYVSKMLPNNESKKLTVGQFFLYTVVGSVFGPIFCGVLSYFANSLRLVYYIAAILSFLCVIFTLLYVINKQTHLELIQQSLKDSYQRIIGINSNIYNTKRNSMYDYHQKHNNNARNSIDYKNNSQLLVSSHLYGNNNNYYYYGQNTTEFGQNIGKIVESISEVTNDQSQKSQKSRRGHRTRSNTNRSNRSNTSHRSRSTTRHDRSRSREHSYSKSKSTTNNGMTHFAVPQNENENENELDRNENDDGNDNDNDNVSETPSLSNEEQSLSNSNSNNMSPYDNLDWKWIFSNDHRFPITMLSAFDENILKQPKSKNMLYTLHRHKKYSNYNAELTFYEKRRNWRIRVFCWFIKSNSRMQSILLRANATAFSLWYTVYLYDEYDANIIISTSQLFIAALFAAVSMFGMINIYKRMQETLRKTSNNTARTNDSNHIHSSTNSNYSHTPHSAHSGSMKTFGVSIPIYNEDKNDSNNNNDNSSSNNNHNRNQNQNQNRAQTSNNGKDADALQTTSSSPSLHNGSGDNSGAVITTTTNGTANGTTTSGVGVANIINENNNEKDSRNNIGLFPPAQDTAAVNRLNTDSLGSLGNLNNYPFNQTQNIKDFRISDVWISILTISYIIYIILMTGIYPYTIVSDSFTYLGMFYIYAAIYGILQGITLISHEFIVVLDGRNNCNKTDETGTMMGIRSICTMIPIAIVAGTIGLVWDYGYYWFFYIQAIVVAGALALNIILVIANDWLDWELDQMASGNVNLGLPI